MCMSCCRRSITSEQRGTNTRCSVQVNIPGESGEMGILASHVPSIEQLKPGLVEVIEEAGGSKQFFRMCTARKTWIWSERELTG